MLFRTMYVLAFVTTFAFAQNQVLVSLMDTTAGTAAQIQIKIADRDSMFKALNTMGINYDVEYRTPSGTVGGNYSAYKTVIIVETSFITVSNLSAAYRDSLKAFLNGGSPSNKKSLICFGGDFGYNYSRTGAAGQDLTLCQNLLKFTYRGDNGNLTANNKIVGIGVNAGEFDSLRTTAPSGFTSWNFYPDFVQPLTGANPLYGYVGRGTTDSVGGVGVNESGYVAATMFQDPRYVIPLTDGTGGLVHYLNGVFNYVTSNGGYVPVELTSFAANVNGNSVTLNWQTATELNNRGFAIERKINNSEFEQISFVDGHGTTTETQNYIFTDNNLQPASYTYRLKQIDFDGTFAYSKEVMVDVTEIFSFKLENNYPNPFNPSTSIKFTLPEVSQVKLNVYNALGEMVAELINGQMNSGSHEIKFDASNLSSGIYIYTLESAGNKISKKMMLMK